MRAEFLEAMAWKVSACPMESIIPVGNFGQAFIDAVHHWRGSCGFMEPRRLHHEIDEITYHREYIEEIKSPSLTWSRGGDCDDWACLVSCISNAEALLGFKAGRPCHITNWYRDPFKVYRHLDLTALSEDRLLWNLYLSIAFPTLEDLMHDVCARYHYSNAEVVITTIPLTR